MKPSLILAALAALLTHSPAGQVSETDICIYGGTSGGVSAAITAVRLGRSVVLIEPGRHLGGLSAGGLGNTDIGNAAAIGGYSSEFYERVAAKYNSGGRRFQFEPSVAAEVFDDWIEEHDIRVFYESPLASVTKVGQRITELVTERGDIFRAAMFIDTTYEGDLMAAAGVTSTFGREPNSQYGETLNGVRANTPSHQFVLPVDPYVIEGDPSSGLLPFIQEGDGGVPGEGDLGIQAYNFRLCLTQRTDNFIPVTAPEGYDAADYELLARYIALRVAAGHTLSVRSFMNIGGMPNGKTDINNNGAFSTDFIGMNHAFPDGDFATRQAIIDATVHYIKGFLYFLGNDPRLPASLRTEMQTWGYCADEFVDTGGFGHQIYVREARRMVSDYVMTQYNASGSRVAPDPIGLGSYTMDSHNIQRVVQNGVVRNEGDVQVGVPAPYGIAYQSIVPAAGECDNLFVTFCLSASHIAFGSARMEPVFMITSQSAATAAAFAIDDGVAVQDVDYDKLSAQLRADGQLLGSAVIDPSDGVVVDNLDAAATVVGSWTSSVASPGFIGSDYFHDGNADKGTKSVHFVPDIPGTGEYDVYLRWTENANRATNVPVTISFDGDSAATVVDQTTNGAQWNLLGTYPFAEGSDGGVLVETSGTDGFVIADAALFVPAGESFVGVDVIASDPSGTEGDIRDRILLTFVRDTVSAEPLEVTYTVGGSAVGGDDYPALAGSITIPSGQPAAQIQIAPIADDMIEGDETITVALESSAEYRLGAFASAEATIHDEPFDGWRASVFSAQQLMTAGVAGELDDPDLDGTPNVGEFFGGGNPLVADAPPYSTVFYDGRYMVAELLRAKAAGTVTILPRASRSLTEFEPVLPVGPPTVLQEGGFERVQIPLDEPLVIPGEANFFAFGLSLEPVVELAADSRAFWSFDSQVDGNGGFSIAVTAVEGFSVMEPTITQTGSVFSAAGTGGAASYSDFQGTTWLGSGGSTAPGHSLNWNPGSSGNSFSLTFSTLGLESVRLRMDIRSAQQAGGSAPQTFDSFTYDVGGGPVAVPGIDLSLGGNNAFNEWVANLGSVAALANVGEVTLRWTFADLANIPEPLESFRVDNLFLEADAIEQP